MISRISKNIPSSIGLLGLAGLIPFWGLTLFIVFTEDSLGHFALKLQVSYAAIILSFLGGIHWGIAVQIKENATWLRMGWGVILALIGWGAIFIPYIYSIALLGLALSSALVMDLKLVNNLTEASWYRTLRLILSFGAISALLLTFLDLSF